MLVLRCQAVLTLGFRRTCEANFNGLLAFDYTPFTGNAAKRGIDSHASLK
jgi:hypothetical protein